MCKLVFASVLLLGSVISHAAPVGFTNAGGGQAPLTNGDPVIWRNSAAPGHLNSQLDFLFPRESQLAFDYRVIDQNPSCVSFGLITGIRWLGAYDPGPIGPNQGFNVFLYADAGGVPTGGPGDPSGTALLSQFIPIANSNETQRNRPERYEYSVKLLIPLQSECTTTHWASIQAVMDSPQVWGMRLGPQQGFDGAYGNPSLGIPYWSSCQSVNGTSCDPAIRLHGQVFPEPTSLMFLAIGLTQIVRRRRHFACGH